MNQNKILKRLERIKARSTAIKLIKEEYVTDITDPKKVQNALRILTKMALNNQIEIENIKEIIKATSLGLKALESGKLGHISSRLEECIVLNKHIL
tara:strand:+ start:136 stop:423 length:288 start_codon:yes stop_codon:yes gene_type:complete